MTFQSNFFDYIHIDNVNGRIEDWAIFYSEIHRMLTPGGCIEHSETNVDAGAPYWDWFSRLWAESASSIGHCMIGFLNFPERLADAGFKNVSWTGLPIPATAFCFDVAGRVLPALEPLDLEASTIIDLIKGMMGEVATYGAGRFALRYVREQNDARVAANILQPHYYRL